MKISSLKQNSFLKVFFFVLLFFTLSKSVFASGALHFVGPNSAVAPGGEFVVSVVLDTSDSINAVDLEINYSKENFKFLDFNNAGSIIDFWQSPPAIIGEGKIKLSGGILSGFKGSSGLIIKIYFKALSTGEGKINFIQKNIYLADGKGTLSVPQTTPLLLPINSDAPKTNLESELKEYKKDDTSPSIILTVVENPKEGSELIVFNVVDKESGVKETQIRFKKWFSFSSWISAQNPVLYPKGVWVVELKAVNNAGLENTNTLKMPWRIWRKFLVFLLLFVFLVIFTISRYNKYKRKI